LPDAKVILQFIGCRHSLIFGKQGDYPMAKRAKSISVSQLKSAAQKAAEHAHKKHPSVSVPVEDLYIAPWIICGIPIPWPWGPWLGGETNPDRGAFLQAFAENLAENPALADAGIEGGKIQPAIYAVGNQTIVGVQLGAATFGA
jgi:hypothetical protein